MSSLRRDLPELGDRVSPTPEFLAKHRVVRPEVTQTKRRETWQLETRLYRLCHDRERVSNPGDAWIGTAEYDAANARWYGDWARSQGAQNTREPGERVQRSGHADGITDTMVFAAAAVRAVAEWLGAKNASILEMVVVHDLSWAEIGRRIGVDEKTAKVWSCHVLRDLLRYYDEADGVTRQGGARIRSGAA